MVRRYVPARGDLVWLLFDPQSGREQAGRRPALVLSQEAYNRPSGLALMCPVTSKIKGYPFEVELQEGEITGVVLADQIKSLDWVGREASFISRASEELVDQVIQKISMLLSSSAD